MPAVLHCVLNGLLQKKRLYHFNSANYNDLSAKFISPDSAFIDSLNLNTFSLSLPPPLLEIHDSLYKILENGDIKGYQDGNVWRKAQISFNNKPYEVDIRLHGKTPSFSANRIS